MLKSLSGLQPSLLLSVAPPGHSRTVTQHGSKGNKAKAIGDQQCLRFKDVARAVTIAACAWTLAQHNNRDKTAFASRLKQTILWCSPCHPQLPLSSASLIIAATIAQHDKKSKTATVDKEQHEQPRFAAAVPTASARATAAFHDCLPSCHRIAIRTRAEEHQKPSAVRTKSSLCCSHCRCSSVLSCSFA